MIRKAVGAVVTQGQNILLVHKVKIRSLEDGPAISEWDFPKGGVEEEDKSLEVAILRELLEETGSVQFSIIKQFSEKISFSFPRGFTEKTGFEKQETTMFMVEYTGDRKELAPQDDEISEIRFVVKKQVAEMLAHQNTRDFYERSFK
ncbi:NUDIX domain-containing protein [Sutcliffiella deserti]|uniref:NUDIX domain-containing protein n=1 Tax=Sutcliffiella deserti TaxID=2875501 RepID=UPI001CBF650E|nr:NUDIX hydrolase [Sutcliffiella deserti]